MIDTIRSNEFKKQKYNRHSYNDIEEIVVALDIKNCNKCGKFYLYNSSYIKMILDKIIIQ